MYKEFDDKKTTTTTKNKNENMKYNDDIRWIDVKIDCLISILAQPMLFIQGIKKCHKMREKKPLVRHGLPNKTELAIAHFIRLDIIQHTATNNGTNDKGDRQKIQFTTIGKKNGKTQRHKKDTLTKDYIIFIDILSSGFILV